MGDTSTRSIARHAAATVMDAVSVTNNQLQPSDAAIHGWYRCVLGYPPHLVRAYLHRLGADPERDWVYDPFCGTATTPVEARLHGFATIGTDVNPIALLAARVKLAWDIDLDAVRRRLDDVRELAEACLTSVGLTERPDRRTPTIRRLVEQFHPDALLPPPMAALIPKGFISPKPLLRVLALRFALETLGGDAVITDFMRLALANVIVTTAGNIRFGPEVCRRPPHDDVDVVEAFVRTVRRMIDDVIAIRDGHPAPFPPAYVHHDDARLLSSPAQYPPIGIVITSPPYPNEKDYTRNTRLESVLLGLLRTRHDIRGLKEHLLRSNSRNVFAGDDDDASIADIPTIRQVAEAIEARRIIRDQHVSEPSAASPSDGLLKHGSSSPHNPPKSCVSERKVVNGYGGTRTMNVIHARKPSLPHAVSL